MRRKEVGVIGMGNSTKELEMFKETINQLPYGIGLFDLLTENPLFLNDSYYEMVGYSPKEYVAMHQKDSERNLFPADKAMKEKSAKEFQKTGKALNYEYRIIHKDGSIRWVKMNATVMQIGGVKFAFSSFVDITKEKETYLQVTMIAENTNSSVSLYKVDKGKESLVYANEKYFEMLGVSREEYIKDIHAFDHVLVTPQVHEQILDAIRYSYKTGEPSEVEHEFIRPDGQILWLNRKYRVIPQEEPNVYMLVAIVTDCTEKKKAQDAEHEQNLKMTNLLNELPGGVAIFKVCDRPKCLYFSDGFAAMSGRGRDEVAKMLEDDGLLTQGILPEYYEDFFNHLREDNPVGKTLSFTYRFIQTTGEIGWLHVAAIKISEEDGCPVYYCIYTNPTDETALYRSVVEDSAIGVYIADRETRTNLYANEAFCQLSGFEIAKISGKKLDDILRKYNRKELLTKEQVASLSYDQYSEFHVSRNQGRYLAIKAKALMWNHVDSYILYISDETTEHAGQLKLEQTLIKEQTLMGAIPGGAAIYRAKKDGRTLIEYASDGFCDMLGYSREELLASQDVREYVFGEDVPMAMKAVEDAISQGKPISTTYRCVKKDGEIFLNHLDAKTMFSENPSEDDIAILYAVHSKISDESKLAMQEQQYYRMILDMTGTAYFEWNQEDGFYSSEDYKKYAMSDGGYDAIMGSKQGIDSVHPDDAALMYHYILNAEKNNSAKSVTVRMKMRDGHYQWTQVVSYAKKDEAGNVVKVIGVLRDVDKEWIEKNKKLQAALDAAEKANRAKTAFLSRVSHDMRTPLNGILGLTAFLKESITDKKAVRDVEQLEISGQYLLNLINDTLDVSRIENGKLELHPIICDGKETFDNIIKLAKPSVEAKHLEFILNTKNIHFTKLFVDVGRVEQIIMNIIGNAVKFTPEGGTIECSMEQLDNTSDSIVNQITIRDSGIGMSKEFLPIIFDAFSQADNNQTNARQGTGLGMAITKQLVDLMGGSITVESELGKGSSFTIVLPFKKATEEQILVWKTSLSREKDDSILREKHVLLCEDHPLNREIATRLLQDKGMIVESAENGKIGVEMFKNSSIGYYDVVLMDVRMPQMDGLDTTRTIRKLSRRDAHTIPIIAMTGNSFDEDIAKTLDAGMNAHLSKPIDSVKLFETLREQLVNSQFYSRKKVLVVDDVELNRAVIRVAIEADYDVEEAVNGVEALEILQKQNRIDVIITDMMMMKMDGLELIKRVRANSEYDHIAIIANTQYEELTREDEIIALGANGIIYKPNNAEDILLKLHNVLMAAKREA